MIKLLDMACKTIADMIKDKTPEEVRQTFNIPNDLEDPQVCDDSWFVFFSIEVAFVSLLAGVKPRNNPILQYVFNLETVEILLECFSTVIFAYFVIFSILFIQ